MSVRFILGRAGAGKTRFCLDAILAEQNAPTHDRNLILLVPEQASFQMERELALRSTCRGFSRAEVLSFSRLARRVIDQLDAGTEEISPQGRVLALRAVAAQSAHFLHAFGSVGRSEGFFRRLSRLLEELMNEAVSVAQLRAALEQIEDPHTHRRVSAIAVLYDRFLASLAPRRIDPALRQERLRDRLNEADWLDGAQVWVDGFAGFTGQELGTLAALVTRARSLDITLLLDPHDFLRAGPNLAPPELRLFHRTEATYDRLRALLRERGAEIRDPILLEPSRCPRFLNAPSLALLEVRLAGKVATHAEKSAPLEIRVLSCETHRDELIQAARHIRQSVMDSGGALRFRDFAIIARDLEPFARLIAEVLDDYEIPFFLDRRRPLGGHPLPRMVASTLAAAARDCRLPTMLRLLRSGLLPLSRDVCERIENQALAGEMQGREIWRRANWRFADRGGLDSRELDEGRAVLMAAIEPLLQLHRHPQSPASFWCTALYECLEKLNVRHRLEQWMADAAQSRRLEAAETHRLAWDALARLLDDVVDILGDQPLSAADFAAIVDGALRETTLGLAPPTVDQVLVSSIERSRHPEIKHAWLFAFNDGIFPARPADDAILTEAERELLLGAGLGAPAPARADAFAERMLAYIAVTRASRGLTISYARVAADGSDRFASPLLRSILQAVPGIRIQESRQDGPIVTEWELASAVLQETTAPRAQAVFDRLVDPQERIRIDWLLRGRGYSNRPAALREQRHSTRAGCDESDMLWSGSASQVETFVQCPFKYFSQYDLRIEAQRGPQPVEWELGTLAHAVLASTTRRAINAVLSVRDIVDPQWEKWLDESWLHQENVLADDPAHARPQFQTLKTALRSFVREVLLAQAHRWRRGEFEPLATEQRFGRGVQGEMAALEVVFPGAGRIRVQGSIDRIDGCKVGDRLHLLIYDYKPGATSLNRPWLTGARLQAFLYLLAAEQSWAGGENVVADGAMLSPLYPTAKALKADYVQSAPRDVRRMYLYLPRGIFNQSIVEQLDAKCAGEPSPVAMMRRKKDGGIYGNSDAKPVGAVAARLALARETLVRSARGIVGGCVDVAPLVEGQTLACRSCDFRTVCRFEPLFNRPRPAERALPVLAKVTEGEP